MEFAVVAREAVSSRTSPAHVFQGSFPPVVSGGSASMAVYDEGAYSCASTLEEPPNSRAGTSPGPALMPEAMPSCCFDFSVSSPPASEEFVVIDGPLPAGAKPLSKYFHSSASSVAAVQSGLIVVDGPSPADGLGSHSSAATAEMSPDSAHTYSDAPSSVCTGTGCTGSSSEGPAAGLSEAQLRERQELAKRTVGREFPWVESCVSTWDNAVDMVMREFGGGFELRRQNKENLFTKAQENTRYAENRPRRVVVACLQGGKPSNNLLVQDSQKRRNTFSKKIGCTWSVTMQWPQKSAGPKITQACLTHLTPGSGMQEHPCRRNFENELTMAEIDDQENVIRDLHEARVGTKEIYKVLEKEGKVLGEDGKSKVRTMKIKCSKESTGKTTDVHAFMNELHRQSCFVRFKTDSEKRITCVFFATPEQVELLTQYGSVIIQDNTFNTNAYKYQLCLVVVVDKENRTQIACQALVLRERTEDFVFIFECVAEMGKKHPKVIFTDADKAATAAIAQVFPKSLHKYCIFHTIQNIRTHMGGLGLTVMSKVVATFQAAAYALTESDFFGFKRDLLELLPAGSKAYAYMDDHLFGRYEKWASHVHPGAHTLGMSSTQRVESANSAIKQGLTRASTMMDCLRAITKLNQTWMNASQKKTVGGSYNRVALGTSTADGAVRDNLLVQAEPFFKGLREVGASTYAKEAVKSECLATLGYETTVVASNSDAVRLLLDQFEAEPGTGRLQHSFATNEAAATAPLPVTACGAEGNSTGTSAAFDVTMLARTSVTHFVDLIRGQSIQQLLRVTPRREKKKYGGHLVALGLDGFFLCTCLELLIKGLPCRHSISALLDTQIAFNGACVAPRWRTNASDWTMEPIASKPARLAGTSEGSLAAQQQIALGSSVFTPSIENVRSANYANCCAFGKEAGALLNGITSIAGANRILRHCKKALVDAIEVEEATQREVGRTTLFKGIAAQGGGGAAGGRPGGGGGVPGGSEGEIAGTGGGRGSTGRGRGAMRRGAKRGRGGRGRGGRAGGGGTDGRGVGGAAGGVGGVVGPRRAIGLSGQGENGTVAGVAGADWREGTEQGSDGQAGRGWHPAEQTPGLQPLVAQGDGAEVGRQGDDGVGPGLTCGGEARDEAGRWPASSHGCHGAPVEGNLQHQSRHGMGGAERVLAPLEDRGSLSNVATQGGVVSSQGFSFRGPFVARLCEPENFAQARRNGEMLLSNGAQMVAASTAPMQPGPSPPFGAVPADLAREEDYVAPEIPRHRGQSKRHRTGAGRRVLGAGHMAWNS